MVDRNIINKLGLSQEKLDKQVGEMFSEEEGKFLEEVLRTKVDSRLPGTILKGTIVSQIGNDVIVEIGLKSEGVVDSSEFDSPDEIEPGREIEVLLEDTDSAEELIPLSKRKADRIRGWETIINTKKEGDVVKGRVIRRIKGGLLVDIGVPVFLPASQVDIRRPGDISRFIGKEVKSTILKIDVEGRNIVISRRKLIEEERRSSKENILEEIEVGQVRKGVVKNIADFGVFVDLGGLDGLLHISDLSWGRISHPSEVIELDQEIECMVIGVDKEHEKISLGLKQKVSSPWEKVEENYPIDARVKGKVVNVMNYGVFVRLEDGIEGLIHISEMSWTKRLNHPSEVLNLGDEIEAIVLSVNKDKQEISLGLKQTETNPWTLASQKYPVGTIVNGKVRSVTNFGAFVEIEEGIDGMVHISDLSWTRKYSHPGEALQKGQEIKCVVLDVDAEKRRVSLGIKQMVEDPWIRAIPEKYIPGHIIKGTVTKLTNFGAFVELEPDLEGLLHISELADHKIEKPQDIVKEGEEVEVKILKVEMESRKIGLSLRRAQWAAEEQKAETAKSEQQKSGAAETVISDTEQLTKSEEKAEETKEDKSEPAEISEQDKTAVETEADSTEQAKAVEQPEQPAVEQTQENGDAESQAGDDSGDSTVVETKADNSEQAKAVEQPEQPAVEQTQESADAESQAGDDSDDGSVEKKADADVKADAESDTDS
ncbi:MAG: 30S ribosomal protein S1 [Planctomycetota bacterium]|jgi:small subunit ribosomal protein S1